MTAGTAQGQHKTIEVNNLGHDFSELVKDDFDIVDTSTITDSSGHHYLVFEIVPKQPGLYTITHTFSDVETANRNPTIVEKYGKAKWHIEEIKYKSKYTLPVYEAPRQQFYRYGSSYSNTNATVAHHSVNDTMAIPFLIGEDVKHSKVTLKKDENFGGWDKEGGDIISDKRTIRVDYVNKIEALELIHFKHHWSTQYHVAHEMTPGFSTIYAVLKATEPGRLNIKYEDVEIPVEIVSKSMPIKTLHGISCRRVEVYENQEGAGFTTTFHKLFKPEIVTLREGDVIYFKIRKILTLKKDKPVIERVVFENSFRE